MSEETKYRKDEEHSAADSSSHKFDLNNESKISEWRKKMIATNDEEAERDCDFIKLLRHKAAHSAPDSKTVVL